MSEPNVGAAVRRLRGERGMTGQSLAAAMVAEAHITWTKATVANLEAGRRTPSVTELASLCRALSVSAEELIGLDTYRALIGEQAAIERETIKEIEATMEAERLRGYVAASLGISPERLDLLVRVQDARSDRYSSGETWRVLDWRDRLVTSELLNIPAVGFPEDLDVAKLRGHATRKIIAILRDQLDQGDI